MKDKPYVILVCTDIKHYENDGTFRDCAFYFWVDKKEIPKYIKDITNKGITIMDDNYQKPIIGFALFEKTQEWTFYPSHRITEIRVMKYNEPGDTIKIKSLKNLTLKGGK